MERLVGSRFVGAAESAQNNAGAERALTMDANDEDPLLKELEESLPAGEEPPPITSSATNTSSSSRHKPPKWILGDLIGRGAFSSVYAAKDAKTGEPVAIKLLKGAAEDSGGIGSSETEKKERFKRLQSEVEVLRTLSHPHIVRYLGTQKHSRELYIVMEYITGGSVAQRIAARGKLDEPIALRYTGQVMRGLVYLHATGIIHRDLKCANLLIDDNGGDGDGSVKVADFGSARLLQRAHDAATLEESVSSTLHGSTYWMAPEVVRGERYGRRADVWSVGCCLLEMLTGKPPWHGTLDGMNQFQVMFHIASSTEVPPMDAELVRPEVRSLLLKCFERDAKERMTSAELIADERRNLQQTG